jgi:ribosome recycling factor
LAKAKKGGGGKKGGDEEEVEATLPDLSHTRKKMEMVVERFSQEMAKVKVGRASVDMFSDIQVGSYGSVSSAGQVTVKTASSINIAVYDPSMVKTVADAIKDCGMGFSPTVENSNITVFVPKPSKESRDVLIKAASRSAEKVSHTLRFMFFPPCV